MSSEEERKEPPKKTPKKTLFSVQDDNLIDIFSYTGEDRPKIWNKGVYERIGCQPTGDRYRVLRTSNGCPLEAGLREPNDLCCTSKLGETNNDRSLEFLMQLKTIYNRTPAYVTEQEKKGRLPPKLRRLMYWIVSSEIQPLDLNTPVTLLSDNERFLDIVKFSLMIESEAEIWGSHPSNEFMYGFKYSDVFGSKIALEIDFELFEDIVRVTNEVGIITFEIHPQFEPTGQVQLVRVPAVRAHNIHIRSAHPFTMPPRDRTCVIFSDVTSSFRTGISNFDMSQSFVLRDHNGFTVVQSSTTTQHEIASMFNALRETERDIHARFTLHAANDVAPAGYAFLNFQNNSVLDIVTAIHASVVGQKRQFLQHSTDWVSFQYLQTRGVWFKLELHRRMDVVEKFDYWISEQMP